MRVARWGNSLAVRLPQAVVEELALKEGDEVDLVANRPGSLVVTQSRRRDDVYARFDALSQPLPADYKFDRQDANER